MKIQRSLFCRFLGMNKLGGTGLKTKVAAAIVVCIWVYNVAFNIPMFIWANVSTGRTSGNVICHPRAADPSYMLAARIFNFYIPLIITWTSYIGIIYKHKRTMNKVICYIYFSHLTCCCFFLITGSTNKYECATDQELTSNALGWLAGRRRMLLPMYSSEWRANVKWRHGRHLESMTLYQKFRISEIQLCLLMPWLLLDLGPTTANFAPYKFHFINNNNAKCQISSWSDLKRRALGFLEEVAL